MEVVQKVLEQISRRLLTESDLDSSFSFLRSPQPSPLVSTPSLATPFREIMLRDRQDDEDNLQQLFLGRWISHTYLPVSGTMPLETVEQECLQEFLV